MIDFFKFAWDVIRGERAVERAIISAYALAPGLLIASSLYGPLRSSLSIDLEKPFAISELKTEIASSGQAVIKQGVILIAEPASSRYRIKLSSGGSRIWTSLSLDEAQANARYLVLDQGGLSSETPFVGVDKPVTVVVEGGVANGVQFPGGIERVEDWDLMSQRAKSIVSSVLFACVFAFGLSIPAGIPSPNGDQESTGEMRT
jgi:hypothetical protein